jgi:alanine-glyoxylate transaminase/serine-glyoxylate transaminase/serine-pyruvate transaminase
MAMPIVGHLDPYFVAVMNETQVLLRSAFRTKNKLTLPLSATGMGGMEAGLTNVVESGNEVIIGVNGFFGERMSEVVSRLGGKPIRVEAEWGRTIDAEAIEAVLKNSDAKVVAMVNAETSTGVQQPVKEIVP